MTEKTSKFGRILALVLTFVMVATGMNFGMWGAETAWADTAAESVSTAEEFAAMDAAGSYKLTADITVTEPYAKDFTGTFDGDGHTVTLAIDSTSANTGLFSTLAGGAVVKNVTTAGSVAASGKNYVGGIAGFANTYEGAITIENCKNTASVSGNKAVGGILGYCTGSSNSVIIQNCANTGAVTGSNTQVGGIAGNLEYTHVIKNCYNTGNITGFNNYAGIIGRGAKGVSIENCYTTGVIAAYGTSTNAGYAIIGSATSSTTSSVTNSYALEGCATTLVYASGISTDTVSGFKTADEMQSADFASALGSAFMAKSGDYPALSWETPTAKAKFDITPADATLTIDGKTYTGSVSVSLAAGSYSYTVSCEGYASESGSLEVTEEQANSGESLDDINVSLFEDADKWGTVSFTLNPTEAEIVLKDGENVLTPQAGGAYKVLKNRTYKYNVTTTEEGYEEESGNYCFSIDGDSKVISLKKVESIALSGTYKKEYTQGESLDIAGLVVTATYSDGSSAPVTITKDDVTGFNSAVEMGAGVESVKQNLTVTYKSVSTKYEVTINEKTFPSSVFNGLKGKATVEYTHNSSFTGETGKEFVDDSETAALKSNSAGMSSSEVAVKITIAENVKSSKISFEYKVSSETSSWSVSDGLKINNGSKIGTTSDFVKYTQNVKGGDEITLAYVKDYSSDKGSDCIWLKNFQIEELHSISISPKDGESAIANASISLKNSAGDAVSADTDGKYYVTDGTYTYTVTKFGYADASGEITVSGADVTKDIAMTKLAVHKLSFKVALPEGLSMAETATLVKKGDVALDAETDGSYKLPDGEYNYTITHPSCDTVSDKLRVAGADIEESVALVRKLVFADLFAGCTDYITATDDATYPFKAVKAEDGNYLESSNNTSYSKSKFTLKAKTAIRLDFEAWVSSGGYSADYGLVVKKNEAAQFQKYGESTDWEKVSVICDKDDIITVAYNAYYIYSSSSYDNIIRARNFTATPLYTASFSLRTEDATLIVKDAQDKVLTAGADGKYSLENGTYSYEASKYGYQAVSGSFTINGENQDITVPALTELEKKAISFSVKQGDNAVTDATITVSHDTQGAIESTTVGSYSLPVGETYKYSVTKENYIAVSGTFTVSKDETIDVTLVYAGEGWDGTTKTEPEQKDGVYQIGTAAELARFADKANEDPTISGKLTANINLNDKTWTAIGSSSNQYAGTFDGSNHIISGLKGSQGLFDTVGATGVVQNLSLIVNITGSGKIGGICGTLYGKIENSLVDGKIANSSSYGCTGGIAACTPSADETSGTIKNCVNKALVENTYAYYGSSLKLGGIVGYTYGIVENCYNVGSVKAGLQYKDGAILNYDIGGLVGVVNSGGALKNSYTIASVTGPTTGIGAVAGKVEEASTYYGTEAGIVKNVHYLTDICEVAIANDKAAGTAGTTGHTAAEMKTALFAYGLGTAFNQDTAGVNGGYPLLTWQGGSEPDVPEFEQNASADMNAITIKDKTLLDSIDAKKSVYHDYYKTDDGIAEGITTEEKALEFWKEFFYEKEGYQNYGWDDIYAGFGIDIEEDGIISPNSDSVYRLPEDCTAIYLPVKGENGSTITWTSDESDIIAVGTAAASDSQTTATVSRPTDGNNKTITLTATVKNNNVTKTKAYKILVASPGGIAAETLDAIADQIEKSNTYIQPMQMYDHENITDAMVQYLDRQGYDTEEYCGEGIRVELVSIGTKDLPNDGVEYLAADGKINSYYKGTAGFSTTSAIYNNVTFKLSLEGVTKEVTIHVHIGWDVFYVEEMLEKALKDVTWDSIKGDNTNTSTDTDETTSVDGWKHTRVDGSISQNLTVPTSLSKYSYAKISWSTVGDDDYNYIYFETEDDGTTSAILQRPPKADEGQPSNDEDISLRATATFNFWDDYTVSEMTSQGTATEPAEAFKFFDMTIAEGTEAEKADMKAALVEKYPSLIRDFVDKEQTVNMNEITADLQLPRPSILEDNGIMSDSYNQKVTMTSGDTDVLEFMGYHAVIYRPLPGEDPATVEYTVTITDRRTKNVLAQNTFEMTVQPLTQAEIDAAAAWMKTVTTEDVYWNGIKGENTDKNNVISNLKTFEEILKDEDGSVEYVRGTVNITFGGIDVDDLPGYDSMNSQPWREFRSDYNSVIECETLFVTTPEYDTEVTIDSVFTDSTFGKYWEKFQANEDYAQFAQFYKQPVSVTVTVKGEKGADPNPDSRPTTLSATVSVDGKKVNGFKSTSAISVSGLSRNATAWDAVTTALTKADYKYDSFGDYIKGITDPNGVTLTDSDTENSGWLYMVNNKLADVYLGSYYIKNGDSIKLYYTSDYTTDEHAGGHSGSGSTTTLVTTPEELAEETTETAATVFVDVPASTFYNKAVEWAVEKGITTGTDKAHFSPAQTCTRAQIVTFLWRAAGSPEPKDAGNGFADVPGDAYYAKAVAWAIENGITLGTSATTFSPEDTCTRAQGVAFLYRAQESPAVSGSPDYTDVAVDAYYAKAVKWAEDGNVTKGIGGGLFGSDDDCTRAHIVTFLYRSMNGAGEAKSDTAKSDAAK